VKPVAGVVGRLLRGLGIASEVASAGAVDAWGGVAVAAFGADASATHAVAIDGATLIVAVPTSAWASEIRLREHDLLAALERSVPGSGIRSIRTVPAR